MDTVNSQTAGNQGIGTVAALDGGGYVIAWRGVAYGGQAIWFQRYDAQGAKVGAETWAKDVDPAGKEVPQLMAFEGGGFAVNGKYYDAAGIPTFGGGNVTLAQHYARTPEGQHLSESDPTIAGLPGGGYVTVESKTVYVQNYPGETFVIRWFNEAGQQQRQYERPPEAGEMAPVEDLYGPAITVLADGKVLVTWEEAGRRAGSAEFDLFSADGRLLRHEDVAVRGGIGQVEATPLPNGGFVVSWAGSNYAASPNGYYQQYDANGARVGETVNLGPVTFTSDALRVSSTTTLENGDVVLVFDTRRPDGTTDIVVEHLDGLGGAGEEPPPPPTGDGQVINSPGPGSTLQGGAGADTLNASQGPDQLTGGGGGDYFAFGSLPWRAGVVTDFADGSDKIDLRALYRASGYTGSDAVADRYVTFESDGAGGTRVMYDTDGAGSSQAWSYHITTLQGVAPSSLSNADLVGGTGGNQTEPGPGEPAAGQVLTSDQPGDTLTGGAGNDTLNAGQGPDQLTGAGGADHFVFAKPPWNAGVITDFAAGADKVDISALLDAYTGTDPMADGWLRLDNASNSTKVFVDIDGAGGEWPFLITTLQGVAPSSVGLGDFIL